MTTNGQRADRVIEVYFNPLNIIGLKNTELFDSVFNPEYLDIYLPINEIAKPTDDQINKLKNTENLISQQKPIKIDLKTMTQNGQMELKHENGLMKFSTVEGVFSGMVTEQQFRLPLKIQLRAKTDSENGRLTIKYDSGEIALNFDFKPTTLFMTDIALGETRFCKNRGKIPVDEFVDIEWILGRSIMAVKVNGEIRYIGDDNSHIKSFNENPNFSISSAVTVAIYGAAVTVESLQITEI